MIKAVISGELGIDANTFDVYSGGAWFESVWTPIMRTVQTSGCRAIMIMYAASCSVLLITRLIK